MLSLYSIYTKRVLPHVNQEVLLLSYYNNAYSLILFIPLIIVNGELFLIWNFKNLHSYIFWMQMIGGGICGFAIGYVTSLQIKVCMCKKCFFAQNAVLKFVFFSKVTSPLTHNISGTAKACAQTIIATHWYNETKTFLWWVSNIVVLCASAMYARFKQLEMEKNAQVKIVVNKDEKENLV